MAENDLSALRGQLVQMIVQQGAILANWLKFAITVQGGLVAGLGFVLSDVETYRILGVIVAIFGALTAYLFAKILCRQSQWGGWYIERCNTLTPTSKIFPDKTESYQPAKIDPNQPVEIAEQIWRMVAAFIL